MRPSLQLVGLSLSFCIQDVLRGRVRVRDIAKISTGTDARTRREFEGVLRAYRKSYWRQAPRRATYIARRLWQQGRIEQPLTQGRNPISRVDGNWQHADGRSYFPPWNEP